MKLQTLLLSCALPLLHPVLHAQIGLYGQFDLTRLTNESASNGTFFTHGGTLGLYDDFLHLGPLHAGVDLRGDLGSGGSSFNYRSILGGVRVGAKLPVIPLRPYVQGSIGSGGVQYTGQLAAGIPSSGYNNKFTYEIFGGLDYTILPHLDARVEGGGGQQSATSVPQKPSLATVNTGLVLRF